MKTSLVLASIVALANVVGCSGSSLNSGTAGADGGGAGSTGTAGTTGAAGTTDVGGAGTTGAAGETSVAGATGTAGTTPTAGTTGTAGQSGTAGAAGTTAEGGMSGGGGASAGAAGTAGVAGGCGVGGTTGAAGTVGTAGISGAGGTGGSAVIDGGAVATNADGTCKAMAFKHSGVCVCQAATPKACATSCVDLRTNNDNCGACGNACAPHATCNAGVCGPSPTTFVAKPVANCGAMSLVAANGTLTWSDTGNKKVFQMSTSAVGATPTAISRGETTSPTIVVVRGPTVFWLDGRVIRKSVCGAISVVTTSPVPIHGLAASADGGTVFFSTGDGLSLSTIGKVTRVAAIGGLPLDVVIEEKMGIPGALANSGSFVVYPTDINGDVDIATIGATPAQCWASLGEDAPGMMNLGCNRIARSQGSLNQTLILASSSSVFWADGHNVKMNALGATAPSSNKALASPDNNVQALALGGTKVFFTEFDDGAPATGTVQKVPMLEGANWVALARNLNGPASVAVDGNKVFFSTKDCEIQTIPTGE